jgi:hypothetical protein
MQVIKGEIRIFLKTKGNQHSTTMSDKKDKVEKKFIDVASLIRASAAAYQLYAAEEEIGIQYEILNTDSQAEESVNLFISESFSSYLPQTSNEDDEDEGSEDDREAKEDDRNRREEVNVVRDENCDLEDERSTHSDKSVRSEGMSQASSHISSVSSLTPKRSMAKPQRQTRKLAEIPTDSCGLFDLISFLT